jgi:cytochrome P450
VHACLGAAIARLAIKVSFEEFLQRIPDFEQVDDELPWIPSTNFRSPMRLEFARA